jgi:catechol 2,3-dioxygenase-like lactoylglutathione lyase family enzyme
MEDEDTAMDTIIDAGLTHVSITSVPVADRDRAKTLYVETLGFELLADAPWGEGPRWVQFAPKGAQSLTLVTWSDMSPGVWTGPDRDPGHRPRLRGASQGGLEFTGPPFDAEGKAAGRPTSRIQTATS